MKIVESAIQMCASRQTWQMGTRGRDHVMGATCFQDIASKMIGTKYDTNVPKHGQGRILLGNPYNNNGVGGIKDWSAEDGITKFFKGNHKILKKNEKLNFK